MSTLQLSRVSFSYPGQSSPVFEDLSLSFHEGWTALVGPNGSGKTTLALLAAGLLEPDSGRVTGPGGAVICPQVFRGTTPDDYALLYDYSTESVRLRRVLGLDEEMLAREESLSGGEKKRLQIFLALASSPGVLILDEPTNHLDTDNKAILLEALRGYSGVGMVISHDRAFLDSLSKRTIVFSFTGEGTRLDDIPLPATKALEEKERRQSSLLERRKELGRSLSSLEAEARRLEAVARASASRLSKKGISPKDHDAAGKINAARLSGKDRAAGDRKKAVMSRAEDQRARLDSLDNARLRKTGLSAKSFGTLHSTLVLPENTIRAGGYTLSHPALEFPPGSRTLISGPNGAGKSLLVGEIRKAAEGKWGKGKVAFLPQEYSPSDLERVTKAFLSLDDAARGALASDLYRMGSEPGSFLEASGGLSPGEARKLDLLLSLTGEAAFIIMDEPTNHLDITSITALEDILSAPGPTIVLVSHDEAFRNRLTERKIAVKREGFAGSACPDAD